VYSGPAIPILPVNEKQSSLKHIKSRSKSLNEPKKHSKIEKFNEI